MVQAPTIEELLAFVTGLAEEPRDGDLDEDGDEISIENDEAWEFTLATVAEARRLLGQPDLREGSTA